MAIIPSIRCSQLREAFAFYTQVLDFEYVDGDDPASEHGFLVLAREGHQLFLSNHDGGDRSVIAITVEDVDAVFRKFRTRGLKTPGNPDQPVEVHEGPIDQTWGTREFYVEDLDGNSLRFTQLMS